MNSDQTKSLCVRGIELMEDGSLSDFAEIVATDAFNREATDEPAPARERGPAAFLASAQWLHAAFDELAWEVHEVVADAGLTCVHATMSGRHTRPFVIFGADGRPRQVFPPKWALPCDVPATTIPIRTRASNSPERAALTRRAPGRSVPSPDRNGHTRLVQRLSLLV